MNKNELYIDTDSMIESAAHVIETPVHVRYPHIHRMRVEYAELCMRLDKLCKYYDVSSGQLTDKQRDLMCKQITAMRAYADVLQQRINYDIQYYSK